jgi:hypothetical protein
MNIIHIHINNVYIKKRNTDKKRLYGFYTNLNIILNNLAFKGDG